MEAVSAKKKPGRPKGSRNKPPAVQPVLGRLTPPSDEPLGDYKHADPQTVIERQWALLDWAQQATRNEMTRAMQASGHRFSTDDVSKLEKLSNAIVRAIDAMKKAGDLADEIAKRLTAEQLLEAALKKIEGQDLATLRYAIRRLRNYVDKSAPTTGWERHEMGDAMAPRTDVTGAASTVAELDVE